MKLRCYFRTGPNRLVQINGGSNRWVYAELFRDPMSFCVQYKALFRQIDSASSVSYRWYSEMINNCVQAFFALFPHWPFSDLSKSGAVPHAAVPIAAVPSAKFPTDFKFPKCHEAPTSLYLNVAKLGKAGLDRTIQAIREEQSDCLDTSTVVNLGCAGRPIAWPYHARIKIRQIMKG